MGPFMFPTWRSRSAADDQLKNLLHWTFLKGNVLGVVYETKKVSFFYPKMGIQLIFNLYVFLLFCVFL